VSVRAVPRQNGALIGATPTLSPPKTSAAQDTKFFTEVGEGDSKLASYEETEGNTALRALLTAAPGSAPC
jgi:hypothetical protein